MRSNSMPLGGRPTDWRTITPQRFSLPCEVLSLPGLTPSLGDLAKGLGIPSLTLKASRICLQFPQGWGNKIPSWRTHTKPCVYQDPGDRAVSPQEMEPNLPASAGHPLQSTVGKPPKGQGHWQQQVQIPVGMSPRGSCCHCPYSKAC